MHILAKPKSGTSNLVNDRLYAEMEVSPGVQAFEWTPARMLKLQYDVLHIHWPENVLNDKRWFRSLIKVLSLYLALSWVKLFDKKVVWTAHNLVSHDNLHPLLERFFWWMLFRNLDGIVTLSSSSAEELERMRPQSKIIPKLIVPHGNYCGIYPNHVTKVHARERFGFMQDDKVLLNLGVVRRYKKVERLIDIAREMPQVQVLVAGSVPDKAYGDELRLRAKGLKNVNLYLDFVPDHELQYYLNAADYFILPYDKITNSGSAILALSYNLPVIAPRLPCFVYLQQCFGEPWICLYEGQFEDNVESCLLEHINLFDNKASIDWDEWEWSKIASKMICFFNDIV